MADLMARRPLEGLHAIAELGLKVGPAFARYNLRASEVVAPRVGDALGFALPQTACRSASLGDRHALWLGPDEWLLLSTPGDALGHELLAALSGQPQSLVKVSDRQTALILSGPRAVDLISAGCPLDLGLSAFPVGMCTRTLFGKAEIVLWRTGEATFHIEVWRSFAGYVWGVLEAAGVS
jgi:sarcosine oxidase subunit gamma